MLSPLRGIGFINPFYRSVSLALKHDIDRYVLPLRTATLFDGRLSAEVYFWDFLGCFGYLEVLGFFHTGEGGIEAAGEGSDV